MDQKLILSPSPHIHSGDSIQKNMYHVLIALVPAFLVMVYQFRLQAVWITALAAISCLITEWVITKYLMRRTLYVFDGSALLTGVLLAFNLPASLPWWLVVLGSIVAIGIGKMAFGGLGNNVFNPALVGRVFLLISYPAQMTTWPVPASLASQVDGSTMATPLAVMKGVIHGMPASGNGSNIWDLALGLMPGSMGETAAIALLLGFGYMLVRRIITWHTPVAIFAGVVLVGGLTHLINPSLYPSISFHLLSGGLMLGAIFMATDYVTSPITPRGQLIYGFAIGVITVIIRLFGSYPEGMSFAILIMNAFTPLINNYVKPKHFGHIRQRKEKAQ